MTTQKDFETSRAMYDDYSEVCGNRTYWYICSQCQHPVPPPRISILIPGGRIWMEHCDNCGNVQSVQITDGRRTWWVAKADAEINNKK